MNFAPATLQEKLRGSHVNAHVPVNLVLTVSLVGEGHVVRVGAGNDIGQLHQFAIDAGQGDLGLLGQVAVFLGLHVTPHAGDDSHPGNSAQDSDDQKRCNHLDQGKTGLLSAMGSVCGATEQ